MLKIIIHSPIAADGQGVRVIQCPGYSATDVAIYDEQQGGGRQGRVVASDRDRIPHVGVSGIPDLSQAAATGKGIVADACHATGDLHERQTAAVIKGIAADARHVIPQHDFCQFGAAVKSIGANARHAVSNRHAAQFATAAKSRCANILYRCWDRDAR